MISSSTGQITGSPNSGTATAVTNGEYSVTVTVVDADGNTATSGANKDVDTVSFTITVAADTKHAFASTPAVGNRTYIATQAITALQLPAASGGNGNPVYSATGLPGGLLFSSSTRRITGTPTAPTPPATLPAVSTVTYKVDDSDSNNAGTDASTLTFTITIVADTAPVFSASMSNQTEIATQAVDITLPSASGGNGATVYSVQHRLSTSSGTYTAGLPSGLSFSASTRKITGSHATAATYTIRYIAADSDADNTSADRAEQTFNIQFASDTTPTFANTEPTTTQTAINGLLLVAGQTITNITLPAVTAKGNGAGDTVYSIDASSTATSQLPSGLVFNAGTRVISGTLGSATAATYTITYRAHDADADTTAADSATLTYSLVVAAESAPAFASGAQTTVRGTISTNHASGNLGSAKYIKGQNIPELQLPAATGGNGSLTYSIDESLPAGISFSASTRKLTGSTSAASTGTLTYRVEDADANSASNDEDTLTFTINFVNDSRPSFSASSIGNINAIANSAITNVTLPAPRNGNLGTTISLNDSDVAGISFSTATRVLSGTPTAAGTYNMTYKVVDGDANSAAGDETELTFDIIVAADSAPDFASSAAAGPFSYDVGIAIGSVQLPTVATAGNGATAYSLSPAVPGLTLNTATGVLSGTPTTSQSATDHTYRAQDADGNSATTGALKDSDEITIRISVAADSAPDFGSQTISNKDNFVEGKQITAISPTAATGGNGTLAYSASGLPAGLVISASTGSITGTPSSTSGSASGTDYSVTITVHDADINRAGTDADTLSFTITVYDNLRPAIAANTIAGSTIDQIATQAFSLTLPAASSGNGDLSLSISGAPASLSFDTATRVLSGMPTEAERTAAGANPYAITYTVKDSDNDDRTSDQASLSFSLNLVEDTVPAFASTTLSGTTRNYIRNSQITNLVLPAASGGNGAIVYADLSTALPNGLTWTASTRTISGTPTAAGDTTITWTARDSDADTSNADRAAFSFTISVADDSHPTFSAAVSAQSAIEGQSFTLDMPSVSGGNGTLSYSASGLPAGLSISTSTGQITGDPDAGASTAVTGGAYSVTVTVTDNDGNTAASGANKDIDTRTFTITVAADTKHVFASTPAVGNQTYVATLAITALQLPSASGGNGNPVYSVSGLPDGLAFSSTTRRITGSPSTPTAPPETSTVTYKVDDSDSNNAADDASTLSFDITVVANTAPAFSSTTLSGTTRNLIQNSPMMNLVLPAASGGNGAIVYADLSTALPTGLSWSASTRTISGTPTGTGNTTITWTARDSDSDTRNSDRASFSFTISVAADSVPSFSGSVSDQDAIEGQTITAIDMPSASGGNGTLSYGASGLPSGLSISSSSGQITGAPDAGTAAAVSGGEYSVTVTVSDADGNTATSGSKKDVDTVSFTITVAADTKHAFASSVSNQTYIATQQIDELQLPSASGGNGDPDYAVSALPDGLTFTESSLKITGTPNVPTPPATLPATRTITYSVIDADDNTANTDKSELTFDITIVADTVPAFPSGTSISNKAYIQNTQINDLQLPAASGGNGAIQYSVSNLPVGLVASNDKPPKITGTPTTAETKSVTYTAKDSDKDNAAGDQVSLTFTIEVAADTAPDFGSGSVSDQNTVEGQAITAIDMPSTTGGNGDLAYSAGSTLPDGLVINSSSGQITGTPNAGASASSPYTVTVTVSDADDTTGSSDEDSLSFTINVQAESAPSFGAGATRKTIANLSLDNGVQMTSETLPEAAGGNYGRTYSLCLSSDTPPACTLPGGLAFNAPTRVLSGTPNANGSYAMTYKAADGDGKTGSGDEDSLTFTITVAGNVKPTLASNTVSGATYNWVTGTAASLQLPAGSGGNGALSYELNDSALPNGLVWSSSARTISGTPSATTVQAGAAMTYAVTDADSDNAASDKTSINFTIKVQTNSAPAYGANAVSTFTSALSTLHTQGRFVAGLAIPTITVPAASGGNYGLTYSVDGLPAALSFNAGTRQLTGTAHSSVGDSPTFTARVRDNDNNTTAGDGLSTTFKFTTVANVKPTFPTAQSDISDLIQNSPADITLPAGSGGNIGRSYILNEADLPGGLSWSASTRKITGTPTAATDANGAAMTYKVRDDDSDTASSDESSMTFKIIVAADAVPAFAAGASISNRIFDVGIDIGTINLPAVSTAGNGTTVYSLSPAVPGLTLNTATGALTGAPTGAQAETTHTYRAGDADGNTAASGATKDVAELTFTITVRGDSRPMFASADPVADQEWAVGHRVAAFTLPEASGGNGTLSYDINDEDLPGGLAWNAGTRTISGTPLSTTVSAVTITYTVADADSNTETDSTESGYDADSATFTIKITADSSPALAADAAPDRTWVTGSAASAVLPPATGGNRPLTYAVTGTLPRGVVWTASTRTLGGTPTESGTFNLAYRATDPDGDHAERTFTLTIDASDTAPAFAGGASIGAQSWTQGKAIAPLTLPAASGGNGTLTYRLDPAIPGLAINQSTRQLSGTPRSSMASTSIALRAADADQVTGSGDEASLSFNVTVGARDAAPGFPSGTTISSHYASIGTAITNIVLPAATGGNGALSYAVSGLPGGLVWTAGTRTISGTPSGAGGVFTVTYTASDSDSNRAASDQAARRFTITVAGPPVFGANGGRTTDQRANPSARTWTARSGSTQTRYFAWPRAGSGNSLGSDYDHDAAITGFPGADSCTASAAAATTAATNGEQFTWRAYSCRPSGSGTFTGSFTAHDRDGDRGASDAASYSFQITINGPPRFIDRSSVSRSVIANQQFSIALPAAGGDWQGNGALTYSLETDGGGALPTGLRFNSGTRTVSGALPAGSYSLEYEVEDADGEKDSLKVLINAGSTAGSVFVRFPSAIRHGTLRNGFAAGAAMSWQLPAASGGTGTLAYRVRWRGGAPAGIAFNAATRTLSGTATGSYTKQGWLDAIDPSTTQQDILTFEFTVGPDATPAFPQGTSVGGLWLIRNRAMTPVTLPAATGGNGILSYSFSPAVPGLVLDPATRMLSGTPANFGSTNVTLSARDTDSDAATNAPTFRIIVSADTAPGFGSTSVSQANRTFTVGSAKTLTLPAATGGNGTLSYELAGRLPSGLAFTAASRRISGTADANQQGYYILELRAADADNNEASSDEGTLRFTLIVDLPAPTAPPSPGNLSFVVGQTVNRQLAAAAYSHGTLTYELRNLPAAFAFDPATRRLTTATALAAGDIGTATVEYAAINALGGTAAVSFQIAVAADSMPAFSQASLSNQTYTSGTQIQALVLPGATANTGNAPLAYTLAPIPSGLAWNGATRTLSGTPDTVGSTSAVYTATDADGDAATLRFTITVGPAAGDVPPSFSATVSNQSYIRHIAIADLTLPAASGGNGAITLSLDQTDASGLPAGLAFDATSRILSGKPTAAGTFQMVYTAVDADGNAHSSDAAALRFTITVADNAVPAFASASQTVSAVVGTAIAAITLPSATGGDGALTYELAPDPLPGWLTYNSTAGTITGTPTASADAATTITWTAKDSDTRSAAADDAVHTITINTTFPNPPSPSVDDLAAVAGHAFSRTLPSVTYAHGTIVYSTSALPTGARFSAGSRVLSGTISAGDCGGGPWTITYTATVQDGRGARSTDSFDITCAADVAAAFANGATISNRRFTINSAISETQALATPAAGNPPYVYSLHNAPVGISVNSATGVLEGTPTTLTAAEGATVTFRATDFDGDQAELTFTIIVAANSAPMFAQDAAIPDRLFVPGVAISAANEEALPTASGGDGALVYSLVNAPAWLSLAGGKLSGTPPAAAAAVTVTYKAADSDGRSAGDEDTLDFSVAVEADSAPSFGTGTIRAWQFWGVSGTPQTIFPILLPAASGGNGEIEYAISGLPSGLSLNAATRKITGDVADAAGRYSITYSAGDADQKTSGDTAQLTAQWTIAARGTARAFSSGLAGSQFDEAYASGQARSASLQLPKETWASFYLIDGAPPPGMTFNETTAILSGSPTTNGTYPLRYAAFDSAYGGAELSGRITITVEADKDLALPALASSLSAISVERGAEMSALTFPAAASASPGNGSVSYWIARRSVPDTPWQPPGLEWDAGSRQLSGTPTAPAVHQMVYRAKDTDTDTASANFTITVTGSDADVAFSAADDATYGADQAFAVNRAIVAGDLILPEHSSDPVDGPVSYTLCKTADVAPACTLPAGMSFDASTRRLSGTPTALGSTAMTYTVADRDDDTDAIAFNIVIAANSAPSLSDASYGPVRFAAGKQISGFAALPRATGGNPPITYTLTNEPAGVTLDSATRLLGGTPSNVSSANDAFYTATDRDGETARLNVNMAVAADVSPGFGSSAISAKSWTQGTAIATAAALPAATGGNAPITYSLSGAEGVRLSSARVITGAPIGHGSKRMTYTATDADGDTASLSFTATISQAGGPFFRTDWSTGGSRSYDTGTAIPQEVLPEALGGSGAITYTLENEPAWMSFNAATRTISGTPNTSTPNGGTSPQTITLKATDANSMSATTTFQIEVRYVNICNSNFSDGCARYDNANVWAAIHHGSTDCTVAMGTFGSLTRSVPCTGHSATFQVGGFNIWLTGSHHGSTSRRGTFYVTPGGFGNDKDFQPSFPSGMVLHAIPFSEGAAGTSRVSLPAASGGDAPVRYSISGAPAGITIDASTRILSGTPSTAGTYSATLTATDADGDRATTTFTIVVAEDTEPSFGAAGSRPTIAAKTFQQNAEITAAGQTALPAASGGNPPYAYSLSGITGLRLDSSRRIIGKVLGETSETVTYTVTDADGDTDSLTFKVTIERAPDPFFRADWPIGGGVRVYTVGTAITGEVLPRAEGGHGAISYALENKPSWMSFDASSRRIGGTPTLPSARDAAAAVTYKATDAAGRSVSLTLNVRVRYAACTLNQALALGKGCGLYDLLSGRAGWITAEHLTNGECRIQWGANRAGTLGTNRSSSSCDSGTINFGSGYGATQLAMTKSASVYQLGTLTIGSAVQSSADRMPSFPEDLTLPHKVFVKGAAISDKSSLPAADGGDPPIAYSISGAPAGIGINSATRVLTGTPTAAGGPATVTYTATDADGDTASTTFLITVREDTAPSFAQSAAIGDKTYIQRRAIVWNGAALPAATGGNQPIRYAISGAPAGIYLTADRKLAGTPTTAGAATAVTYTATDADGDAAGTGLSFNITVSANELPAFAADAAIARQSATLGLTFGSDPLPAASGGDGTLRYSLGGSGKPAWLRLGGDRRLLGTPAGMPGTYTVKYIVSDGDSPPDTAELEFSLVVIPQPLSFAGVSIGTFEFTAGDSLGTQPALPAASGGLSGSITYSVSGLPPGVAFNAATRVLSGAPTPDLPGPPAAITYTVADGHSTASITFAINVPWRECTRGLKLSAGQRCAGGNDQTGYLARVNAGGTITLAGYTPFPSQQGNTIRWRGRWISPLPLVHGSSGSVRLLNMTVNKSGQDWRIDRAPPDDKNLTWSSTSQADTSGRQGVPLRYEFPHSASGGNGAITYHFEGLPRGLFASGRVISGTPGVSGSFIVNVYALDGDIFAPDRLNWHGTYIEVVIAPQSCLVNLQLGPGEKCRHHVRSWVEITNVAGAGGFPGQISGSSPDHPRGSTVNVPASGTATYKGVRIRRDSSTHFTILAIPPVPALTLPDSADEERVFEPGTAASFELPAATGGIEPRRYRLTGPNPTETDDDLPSWLSWDAATRTVSGTSNPSNPDNPYTTLTYTATDLRGVSVSKTFRINERWETCDTGSANALEVGDRCVTSSHTVGYALTHLAGGNTLQLRIRTPSGNGFTETEVGTSSSMRNITRGNLTCAFERSVPVTGLPVNQWACSSVEPDSAPSWGSVEPSISAKAGSAVSNLAVSGAATGGNGTLTYAIKRLPAGLTATGNQVSGTAPAAGSYTAKITVTDSDAYNPDSVTVDLKITATANSVPALSTPDDRLYIQNAALGGSDPQLPAASGGDGTITYTLKGPNPTSGDDKLPAGLSFSGSTRRLSGTPTAIGTTTVTYTAADTDGDSASVAFDIAVEAESTPSFGSAAILNRIYRNNELIHGETALPAATGGNGAITYTLTGAPLGIGLDAGTRTITGHPSERNAGASATYKATDADGDEATLSFKISVRHQTCTIGMTIGRGIFCEYQESDGAIWVIAVSAAQGWLYCDYYSSPTATQQGDQKTDPGYSGTCGRGLTNDADKFTLRSNGPGSGTWEITRLPQGASGYPAFSNRALSAGPYAANSAIPGSTAALAAAAGGNSPLVYTLSPVPDGTTFDASTRKLTGTPTTAGVTTATYTVRDADGDTATATVTITVSAPSGAQQTIPKPPAPTIDAIPAFPADASIAARTFAKDAAISGETALPEAAGGDGAIAYSLHGAPDGITLSGARILQGTPTTEGSATVTYRATDADGDTAELSFQITITPAPAQQQEESAQAEEGEAGEEGGEQPQAEAAPEESPAEPQDPADPPASEPQAGDEQEEEEEQAEPAPEDAQPAFSADAAILDRSYAQDAEISGETALPEAQDGDGAITYSLHDAPDGITLSSARILQGTPEAAGTATVTYKATDEDGDAAELTFTITITAPPAPEPDPAPEPAPGDSEGAPPEE